VISLRIARRAARDLDRLFASTEQRFGARVANRYRRLVVNALQDLLSDPARAGVRFREDLPEGVGLYHLRHSRLRSNPSDRIARPRHFVVFGMVDGELTVFRALHDAMDLARHLGDREPG
jgi:plasmid stabilization system protein ParE